MKYIRELHKDGIVYDMELTVGEFYALQLEYGYPTREEDGVKYIMIGV